MFFSASETGTYRGVCAEFCGLQHANLAITAFVHPEVEFDDWAQSQGSPQRHPLAASSSSWKSAVRSATPSAAHRRKESPVDSPDQPLVLAGAILGISFLVATVFVGLPALFFRPC